MREFKVFRALGLSFRAWFRNFVPFTFVAAALYAPVFIWIATVDFESASRSDDLLGRAIMWPLYGVIALSTLLSPILTYRVVQDLNGVPVSMLASIKHGARGIAPAILVSIIVGVLQFIPLGGIGAAIVRCMWFVAAPAAVVEKLGPFNALSRSSQLTGGRRWGIFGLTFLLGVSLFILIVAWAALTFGGNLGPSELRLGALGAVASVAILYMFTGVVEAVSYTLLRQDKDGVSHEQLAHVFE